MLSITSSTARYSKALSSSHKSQISKPSSAPSSLTEATSTRSQGALTTQQVRAFHVSSIPAAVPKKKQSYSRVRVRTHSQNWQIRLQNWSHRHPCSHCGKEILRHNVCQHCGWYKGVPIFLRAVKRDEAKKAKAALKQETNEVAQNTPSS